MRLLLAELRKLNRPLMWGVMFASAAFCVLLAIGGAHNASADVNATSAGGDNSAKCARLGLPDGPECQAEIARIDAASPGKLASPDEHAARVAEQTRVAAQLNPVAVGAEAAGLMASLPGALALALLAGGHAGGEWSGRTMKNLLVQRGRRWEVLAAKLVSLWVAGVGLVLACWAAIAVAGPVLTHINHMPDPHLGALSAAELAGSQVARSLLVLAAFAAVGLLAAVITRNTIGTMATTAAAFVLMLIMAALPGLGRWTPATWVQGWMGFPVGQNSITDLPTNFWSRFINTTGHAPGHGFGLVGLAALLAGAALIAVPTFRRASVAG